MILPGESLARYKDEPASEHPPAATEHSSALPDEQTGRSFILAESAESVTETAATSSASEFRTEHREQARPAYPASSSSGLEPLPGESLARWKRDRAGYRQDVGDFQQDCRTQRIQGSGSTTSRRIVFESMIATSARVPPTAFRQPRSRHSVEQLQYDLQ